MKLNKALEQSIAVFGESGSGKTVLLSSFYGAMQEPKFLKDSLFHVVADDIGQGSRLHKNYLGMKNSAKTPEPNKFKGDEYAFTLKLKETPLDKGQKNNPFDAVRLTWHDYPGEWFEQDVSGPEEAARRVETFRSLLTSDVALLLVDAQRLIDNAGEEERYLKSLLGNVRNGLLSLKNDLLTNGEPLIEFPRIWVIGLSKADLLPDMNVFAFRDLLIEKAGDDIGELGRVLEGFVAGSQALSIGEDFVLLSSATFAPDRIEVSERIGVELLLPLAAVLPIERHVKWAQLEKMPRKVAENLVGVAGRAAALAVAAAFIGKKIKLPGPLGAALAAVGALVQPKAVEEAVSLAGDGLRKANAKARAKHDTLAAVLTGLRIDLERGEKDEVFLRSLK